MDFTLKFNEEQMKLLSEAVVELPFKKAQPLIQHIQLQVNEQMAPAQKPAEPEAVPEA